MWFLGAQESRGLRGEEFALPAVQILEERARDLEPFKITLQVSSFCDQTAYKDIKLLWRVRDNGHPRKACQSVYRIKIIWKRLSKRDKQRGTKCGSYI